MAAVEPRGAFSEAVSKLARMVSLSREFQLRGGSVSDVDAARRVHWQQAVTRESPLPHAVIRLGEQFGTRLIAGGASNMLIPFGSLILYLAIEVPGLYQNDRIAAELDAMNYFCAVHDDVLCLSGADDGAAESSHLPIIASSLLAFDDNPEEDHATMGRFYYAVFDLQWGNGT